MSEEEDPTSPAAAPSPTSPTSGTGEPVTEPDLSGALDAVEVALLGQAPTLTNGEVAERAGVPVELADELWRLMGFAHAAEDDDAFTEADVTALRQASDLVELGILSPERQSALVRTWGRSYARLAEWQTSLLASVAMESDDGSGDPTERLAELAREVLPRVEELQAYVWRRHLLSASARLLTVPDPTASAQPQAVCFVDIVGYTSRSRSLSERELVDWLEDFESRTLDLVVGAGGRIIKNIGDEVLFVTDTVEAAVGVARELARLGAAEDDDFPDVRAGIAYGDVVLRLGDVFGPTVNLASRLTSVAHPGTVLVDRGAHEALNGADSAEAADGDGQTGSDQASYHLKRVRRVSVKGYSRLAAWVVREHH